MKLLQNPNLDRIASELSVEAPDCRTEVRIESYSCKMIESEKRVYKRLAGSLNDREALAPPQADGMLGCSPLSRSLSSDPDDEASGPVLRDSINRKSLFYLTTTLNASFTDYDFSDVRGEQFSREPLSFVRKSVDDQLAKVVEGYSALKVTMWHLIDKEINLNDSIIYSYNPDYQSDPFSADGALWSFNYFFYNHKLKRIVFCSCRALSIQAEISSDEYQTQWSMEEV